MQDGVQHGTPAPYGRSCQNCVRSKCKCIYATGNKCCERCNRLKKECVPSMTVRKRNVRRPTASKTANLEQKLDTLVDLIRNQNQSRSPSDNELSPLNPVTNPSAPISHASQAGSASDANEPQTYPGFTPISTLICTPEVQAIQQDAEHHLKLFRDSYLACFPCIHLWSDVSAAQLRSERPLLWFTIMMVTCQSSHTQRRMSTSWRSIISQKMVVEHEKSMDLLQGLLVFLGWSHYNKKDKPYLAVFSQLALSLIYDMALNKVPPGDPTALSCFKPWPMNMRPKERTAEERRTVLACFYILSQIAFSIRKIEGLRWTSHLEECLSILEEKPECSGDEVLAALVRIQVIVDHLASDPAPLSPAFSSSYLLSALSSHLSTVKKQLGQALESNVMIQLQLHYAELVVLESGLVQNPYIADKPNFRRYEILSQTVECIKTWFHLFFNSLPDFHLGLSFAHWCQLAQCLMTLYKLTTLNDASWDRAALRRDIDLLEVCDRILAATEEAGRRRQAAGNQSNGQRSQVEEDMFTSITRMLANVRNGWAMELSGGQPSEMEGANVPIDNHLATHQFNDGLPMPASFNFLDDAWLTEIFNVSWE